MTRLTLLLAAAAALSDTTHAEQFDATYSGDGRYVESLAAGNRVGIAMLELANGDIVQVSKLSATSGNESEMAFTSYLSTTGSYQVGHGLGQAAMKSVVGAALDSHDRLIVVGTVETPTQGINFRVARFQLRSQQLDTSFSGDGIADVDFFGLDDTPSAVAIDADDNIVVIGAVTAGPTDTDFGMVRLLGRDGSPDPAFGSGNGIVRAYFDLGPTDQYDAPVALAIADSGGGITVVGSAYDSASSVYRIALARFTRNGQTDSSFCNTSCNFQGSYTGIHTGKRVYYFGSSNPHHDLARDVALSGTGFFYLVGMTYDTPALRGGPPPTMRPAIARFNASGNLTQETVSDDMGTSASYQRVQLSDANSQRVLVAGANFATGDSYMTLQAYSATLAPLSGYGNCLGTSALCFIGGGTTDTGPDFATSLKLDSRGRPLFSGTFKAVGATLQASLFARFTNATGPRPDRIFRHGFQ